MILIVQQGGSSAEMYVHMFDRLRDAVAYKKGAWNGGAYNTSEPIKIPERLARKLRADSELEADMVELLGDVAGIAAGMV